MLCILPCCTATHCVTIIITSLPMMPWSHCCWCHWSVVAAVAGLAVGASTSPWHEGVGTVVGRACKQNVMSEKIKINLCDLPKTTPPCHCVTVGASVSHGMRGVAVV